MSDKVDVPVYQASHIDSAQKRISQTLNFKRMQFWELIPNITSPLAALCFVFYLLYMLKSRQDEKIEKTLSIPNSSVQKKAADKILNEYSDITIAQIKSPEHAVELAKDIIANKLIRYHKTTNSLLIFTGIFAATFLLSQLINKGNSENDNDLRIKEQNSWSLLAASKERLPYAMRTVVQFIKLHQDSSNVNKRIAEFRNFYTLTAIKDITRAEKAFGEWYISSFTDVLPWAGSEAQEIQSIDKGIFWVKFDLKKGDTKTIVTGANYVYTFPLRSKQSTSDCFNIDYPTDEWMTCYPNDKDYIDKLTIIIESDNMNIKLAPISMYRKDKSGKIIESEGSTRVYSPKDTNGKSTLVATWNKIEPSECVGFRVKW